MQIVELELYIIWAIISVIAEILGIISAIHAVMHVRTSQGSVAWVVSLVTFPIVALPAYWILGRSQFEGYVTAKKLSENHMADHYKALLERMSPHTIQDQELEGAALAVQKLADVSFTKDNEVELLIDGEATFKSILDGIAVAKNYVLFQFFIVHDDQIGRDIKDALIAKAQEGVQVFFLYDEIGSHTLPASYKNELEEHGVQVSPFNTRKGRRNRFQINFRNHRKIVVVDGLAGWIGGHNVGDEYLGRDPKFGHWRDTHMKLIGPAVIGAQLSFAVDWHWATGQDLLKLSWEPLEGKGDKSVIILPSGPADDVETASLMFLHAFNTAEKRIWIASPYFVPDDAIISALQLAALRGVDVRILIPDTPDHMTVYLAAFSYFDDASATGVKIFRYTNGFLHAKSMIIDDRAVGIGTANLDNRSFRLNFEVTAIVIDEGFATENEKMFLTDFEHAREMSAADLHARPFWFKVAVRFARLFSPIL